MIPVLELKKKSACDMVFVLFFYPKIFPWRTQI